MSISATQTEPLVPLRLSAPHMDLLSPTISGCEHSHFLKVSTTARPIGVIFSTMVVPKSVSEITALY